MRARSAVIAWTLIAGIAVSACSLTEGEPRNMTVMGVDCATFEAQPAVTDAVAIGQGDSLQVTLCTNPSTGFSWEDPIGEGAATLELESRAVAEPVDAAPGAPGQEAFTFRSIAPGETIVHFVYSQPWAGGTKGAWTLDLTVTVE